jgi:geranylgeranyl diphosphate synthase type I
MDGNTMSATSAARREDRSGGDPAITFEALLTAVRNEVDARLKQWLRPRVSSAAQISVEVGMAAEALAELALRGGKRMRAALVGAAFEATRDADVPRPPPGDSAWSACAPAMMAVELLQAYLLIHDDWMDDDDVRRGGKAVHVLLRERLGDRALGDAAAVLAGDLASGFAQEALLETALPAERVLRAARAFARIQVEVVTGQLAEMRAVLAEAAGPSVETIHALKTASYTVTGPLLLGATLAGADDARCAELERFGRPLGIAFQLRDDLLGVFGDPSATGKPVWNDIRQGKRTALVAELRGDARAEALLARVLGVPDAPRDDVAALVRMMDESGARGRVEARVHELCREARRNLDAMSALSPTGRAWLAGAVSALGDRSA